MLLVLLLLGQCFGSMSGLKDPLRFKLVTNANTNATQNLSAPFFQWLAGRENAQG